MKTFALNRCAMSLGAAAALLAGCNVSQPLVGAPNVISAAQSHHQTFEYTGKPQYFDVPAGVRLITVDALGASGGANYSGLQGGLGGRITAELPVAPGGSLAIFVGGSTNGASGGYNGGGEGVSFTIDSQLVTSYGGGGATDIRESGTGLQDRILVAGGGGGMGSSLGSGGGDGGLGGGKVAGNGANGAGSKSGGRDYRDCHSFGGGGGGGTQHDGGKGGRKSCVEPGGTAGALGDGGSGAEGSTGAGGGGGGGGYYGGGGGGGGDNYGGGGGGGGGSSYAEPRATSVHMRRGWETGNGLVVISW
jgi:hypothetical protein